MSDLEQEPTHRRNERLQGLFKVAIVVAALWALAFSQVVVSLSHTPQIPADVTQMLEHGHSHGDELEDLFPGHDATDHEHQLNALFPTQTAEALTARDGALGIDLDELTGYLGTRPLRPPKKV